MKPSHPRQSLTICSSCAVPHVTSRYVTSGRLCTAHGCRRLSLCLLVSVRGLQLQLEHRHEVMRDGSLYVDSTLVIAISLSFCPLNALHRIITSYSLSSELVCTRVVALHVPVMIKQQSSCYIRFSRAAVSLPDVDRAGLQCAVSVFRAPR